MMTDPLMIAAGKGDLQSVRQLIAAGGDPNAKETIGRTPLYCAALQGHAAVVVALIEAGADVNDKDEDGWTVLPWASYRGHAAVVAVLIAGVADVNVRDDEGRTPLLYASSRELNSAVSELIIVGAHTEPDMWAEVDDGTKEVMLEALTERLNGELAAAGWDCGRAVLGDDSRLTPAGIDYARARLLPQLLSPARWKGRGSEGLAFYDRLAGAIPDTLKADVVPELDATALRRTAAARPRAADGPSTVARCVRRAADATGPVL